MKLRQSPYVPKKQKNRLLKFLSIAMCVFLAAMWLMKIKYNAIPTSDMLIYSGLVLLTVSLAQINKQKQRGIEVSDEHLMKLRENMGTDDCNDLSVFFDDVVYTEKGKKAEVGNDDKK